MNSTSISGLSLALRTVKEIRSYNLSTRPIHGFKKCTVNELCKHLMNRTSFKITELNFYQLDTNTFTIYGERGHITVILYPVSQAVESHPVQLEFDFTKNSTSYTPAQSKISE